MENLVKGERGEREESEKEKEEGEEGKEEEKVGEEEREEAERRPLMLRPDGFWGHARGAWVPAGADEQEPRP